MPTQCLAGLCHRLLHGIYAVPARVRSPPETPPRGPQRPSPGAHDLQLPPLCCQGVPPSPWLALLPARARALTTSQVDGLASIHEFKLGGSATKCNCKYRAAPRQTPTAAGGNIGKKGEARLHLHKKNKDPNQEPRL